ncbi:MAG: cell division protein FtsZ [Chloroflexi bacterium]|nr:cell division protein FtsZ [Chloroflexota bacterium]
MAKQSFISCPVKIKVVGLGGGGSNAVNRMVVEEVHGVEFITANTDAQALALSEAPVRLQLGEKLTRGLGAGGNNVLGGKAAEESRDEIREALSGADMIFIAAGMGGGTGTGSAPVVAQVAKETGALTIAIVTKPFAFEGRHRMKTAEDGLRQLVDKVDTLIIIPNDRLLSLCDQKTGVDAAFKIADDVLRHGVKAISEVVTVPGMINLDFADVKAVMKDAGPAWMSIGRGTGPNRAADAAKDALSSPLLDVSVEGSKSVMFNILGSSNLTLFEVNEAARVIQQAVDPEANIIFGVSNDSTQEQEVKITLITTGFTSGLHASSNQREDELSELLKGLKTEEELDVPSFLRRPMFRRQILGTQVQAKPARATAQQVKD